MFAFIQLHSRFIKISFLSIIVLLANCGISPSYATETKKISHSIQVGEKLGTQNSVTNLQTTTFEDGVVPPFAWYMNNPDGDSTWMNANVGGNGTSSHSAMVPFFSNPVGTVDELLTPVVSGLDSSDELRFDYAYARKVTGNTDSLKVLMSLDSGVTYSSVLFSKAGSALATGTTTTNYFVPPSNKWKTITITLGSSVVGKNVAFKFRGVSNHGNNLYLDNISAKAPAVDLSLNFVTVSYPQIAGNPSTVQVTLQWTSTLAPPESVQLSYKLDGIPATSGDSHEETFFPAWNGNPPIAYVTFVTPVVPQIVGNEKVGVRGFYANDANPGNDSVSVSFPTTLIVTSLPYLQNFDGASDSGWFAESVSGASVWKRGTPAAGSAQIKTPYTAPNVWAVGLTSNYGNNNQQMLYTPWFNLASIIPPTTLSFRHNFRTEYAYDGMVIEYTVDDTGHWVRFLSDSTATGWYNDFDTTLEMGQPAFSGSSDSLGSDGNHWAYSKIRFPTPPGNRLQFRFRFQSDASNVDDGYAIDNFFLEPPTFTLSASTGAGGTIFPVGNVSAYYGSVKTFTMTPDSSNEVKDVIVDGISHGKLSSYQFTNIAGNHTISAVFGRDSIKFRTFKGDTTLSSKPIKLVFKTGKTTATPNIPTAVENVFKKTHKTGWTFLGVAQTNKDSIKRYAWIQYKKAADLGKFFTRNHSLTYYPLDSVRAFKKKSVKLIKALTPKASSYDNPAWAEGIALKLNIIASDSTLLGTTSHDSSVTPPGFGKLVIDTSTSFYGRNIKGMTILQVSQYYDTVMTYYKSYGIGDTNAASEYVPIQTFTTSVLQRINNMFFARMDTTNYMLDSAAIKRKNTFGVRLLGVKSAADTKFLKRINGAKEELTTPIANFDERPATYVLNQNYPNPFNPTTAIGFTLIDNGNVSLKVYNILGQQVATLINSETMEAGMHEVSFNAAKYASGVYFYRLTVNDGEFTAMKKMVLLK